MRFSTCRMSISCSSCSSSFSRRCRRRQVEHRCLLLELERQVRGDGVGQAAGVVDAGDRGQDLGRDLLVELDVLVELLRSPRGAAPRPRGFVGLGRSTGVDLGDEVLAVVGDAVSMRARCTPSTSTFTVPSGSFSICRMVETQPTSYMSSGSGSSLAAAFCATSMICLPGFHRGLERLDRLRAADEQRNHHVREHDHVAQRQQRQRRSWSAGRTGVSGHVGSSLVSSRCEAASGRFARHPRATRPRGAGSRTTESTGSWRIRR